VEGRVHECDITNYKGWYQKKLYTCFFRQEAVRFAMYTPVWWEIQNFIRV
jgi:hypothetical protein